MIRIVPTLLLNNAGFYKTVKFRKPVYLGEPINIVKIFNDKEVNEMVIYDINASVYNREPQFSLLKDIASECFMPLAYGGGVTSIDQMRCLFKIGFEKCILNTAAIKSPSLIDAASRVFGAQSIVVCIDAVRRLFSDYEVVACGGRERTGLKPEQWAQEIARRGGGEIIINAVDRDGTLSGYDLELVRRISDSVDVPVVASGGARTAADFAAAVHEGHASACAAGAMFVFHGPHRAVLINVPPRAEIDAVIGQ